ncbi:MAG: DUF2806 domain-containing protein [Clostridia bacterium]|nr:DUF2806 domain-containing protein [Clostridia bacterium]
MEEKNDVNIFHDVFGSEKPLQKLIECVCAGVGKLYEPRHIRRMAKAKKEEIKQIGEALENNINIPIKYENGNITMNTEDTEALLKRAKSRFIHNEIYKQQNIDSVVTKAYNEIEHESCISDEPVDNDWLYRYFECVGEVSNDEMQNLWSKILVGEIKKPNTYSMRTLDTLKNMTQREAMLFKKVSSFILYQYDKLEPFIYGNIKILKKYGITVDDLLELQDCGLIGLNDYLVSENDEKDRIFNYSVIMEAKQKIRFPIFILSKSGIQILNIFNEKLTYSRDYFIDVCNDIKVHNGSLSIETYEITNIEKKQVVLDKEDILK